MRRTLTANWIFQTYQVSSLIHKEDNNCLSKSIGNNLTFTMTTSPITPCYPPPGQRVDSSGQYKILRWGLQLTVWNTCLFIIRSILSPHAKISLKVSVIGVGGGGKQLCNIITVTLNPWGLNVPHKFWSWFPYYSVRSIYIGKNCLKSPNVTEQLLKKPCSVNPII